MAAGMDASMITSLTGITSAMTSVAPYFEHIGEEVGRRLEGRAFVAHNALFDWRFVNAELVRAFVEEGRQTQSELGRLEQAELSSEAV